MEGSIGERCRAAVVAAVATWALMACQGNTEHMAPAIDERDSVAMMVTWGVNTLISDSGVIKYRIVTEEWVVNTVKQPQRWEFMKGVFFEQFDEKLHVEGYIQADTAWYFDQLKLWHLRGRVRIRNQKGLVYTSEELFWDGLRHEFYSHVFSRVVTPERTIEGTEFRSDEHMEHYRVSNSVGSFVRDAADQSGSGGLQAGQEAADDSLAQQTIRPAAQKHGKQR